MDASLEAISAVAHISQSQKNRALLNAAEAGKVHELTRWIEAGADKETVDPLFGYTALISAALHGHTEVVAALIEAGANQQALNRNGDTALLMAAYNGHISVLAKLRALGANINAPNQRGETALMLAAANGKTETISWLIQAGANIEALDQNHKSAVKHALSNRCKTPAFLLLNALSPEGVANRVVIEPTLRPIIKSFNDTIAMTKSNIANIFIGMFAKTITNNSFLGIPIELSHKILDFMFPTWLRARQETQMEQMPKLLKSLIFSEAMSQGQAKKRNRSEASDEPKEGPPSKKYKPQ